jgi:hypothetical protein
LTVRDCVIRNVSLDGIHFASNSSFLSPLFVPNTLLSDNGGFGILISPSGSGLTNGDLNHIEMESNVGGLSVSTATQTISITVSDSAVSNNNGAGILASSSSGTPVNIMVRNSTIANNGTGLTAEGPIASIRATRSTITGNGTAWLNQRDGAVTSYADNNIDDKGAANNAPTQIIYR